MFTNHKIRITKKVNKILDELKTVGECGSASKVIDCYESEFPEEKTFLRESRNFLAYKTVEFFTKSI